MPIYYTSIADIKGFRSIETKIDCPHIITENRNRRLRRANAEIHSALTGGTSKEIWPRPKLDYKPGFEGGTVLEFCTASVLRTQHRQDAESLLLAFLPLALCRVMLRPCISVKLVDILLRKLRRATFQLPNFSPTGSLPNAVATKACTSLTRDS